MKGIIRSGLFLALVAALLICGACAMAETKSGTCGSNLTWTLDDAGKLTISGKGPMWETDEEFEENYAFWPPWEMTMDEAISSVVMNSGITSICDYAFYGLDSIESVAIPDSVTSIGDFAFCGCSSLEWVELPDDVTSIGDSVFLSCSSLESVELPDGLGSIGKGAFDGCISLDSIWIPASVRSIGEYAFPFTNVAVFEGRANDPLTISKTAFEACNLTVYCYKGSPADIRCAQNGFTPSYLYDPSLTLPAGLTAIEAEAFMGDTSLEAVIVPEGCASIGARAFKGCTSLVYVKVPAATTIAADAFEGCGNVAVDRVD